MESAIAPASKVSTELQEKVLLGGDLSRLTPTERLSYYNAVCSSLGLNPYTRPFEYITLNSKLTLYARKDCTDQLRRRDSISLTIPSREMFEGIYVVTARATTLEGRTDEATGAVPIDKLTGEFRANAMMKAETKAKRRVTLSICGLGMLDETEIEDIPEARASAETQKQTARTKIAELVQEGAVEHHPTSEGSVSPGSAMAEAELPAPSTILSIAEALDQIDHSQSDAERIAAGNRGMQLAKSQKDRKAVLEAMEAAKKRMGGH